MRIVFMLLLAAIHSYAAAEVIIGRVVNVHDGDTITLLSDGNVTTKVRLAEIDAPETDQPYGKASKRVLSDLVAGKTVRITVATTDRYGRKVGQVHLGDSWINQTMVSEGSAWVYRQYSKSPELLAEEDKAKAKKAGIWSLPADQQIPPWEWRKGKRTTVPVSSASTAPVKTSSEATETKSSGQFQCGHKRTCGQMSSCAEAKFHLTQCGMTKLDRDGDGVPCESLCK